MLHYYNDQMKQNYSITDGYFSVEDETDLAHAKSLGSEGSSTPLTWRGDPSETHSDWTIMVITSNLDTVSYNVHKSVLCFGSRHSRYFARLLSQQDSKKMTKVELDVRDAANFPILLDYAYAPCSYSSSLGTLPTAMSTLTSPSVLVAQSRSSEDEPTYMALGEDVNTDNAVSIRFLARKFEIDALMLAVNRFIQKDLNLETGPRYLATAYSYDDARLLESATKLCVENFTSLDKKTLAKLPLDVFRQLISSLQIPDHEDLCERSLFLSEVVCRYLEKHPQFVTADLMLDLTDPVIMPYIAVDAAMGFTSLIKKLSPEDATRHWYELIPFCRRCARSVIRQYGWSDFSIDGATEEYLRHCAQSQQSISRLESLLFTTSFAAALDQAQEDYDLVLNEQESIKQIMEAMGNTLNLMEKMSERKDRYLSHQMKALDDAQKKIAALEKELAESKQKRQTPQPQLPPPPHQQQHYLSPPSNPQRMYSSPHGRSSPYTSSSQLQLHHTPTRNTKSLLDDEMTRSQLSSDSFSTLLREDPAIRDLISPQSIGTEIHRNKILKLKEMRNKSDKLSHAT